MIIKTFETNKTFKTFETIKTFKTVADNGVMPDLVMGLMVITVLMVLKKQ